MSESSDRSCVLTLVVTDLADPAEVEAALRTTKREHCRDAEGTELFLDRMKWIRRHPD